MLGRNIFGERITRIEITAHTYIETVILYSHHVWRRREWTFRRFPSESSQISKVKRTFGVFRSLANQKRKSFNFFSEISRCMCSMQESLERDWRKKFIVSSKKTREKIVYEQTSKFIADTKQRYVSCHFVLLAVCLLFLAFAQSQFSLDWHSLTHTAKPKAHERNSLAHIYVHVVAVVVVVVFEYIYSFFHSFCSLTMAFAIFVGHSRLKALLKVQHPRRSRSLLCVLLSFFR